MSNASKVIKPPKSPHNDRKLRIEQLMYRAVTDGLPEKQTMVPTPAGKVKKLTKKAKSVILRPKKDKEKFSIYKPKSLTVQFSNLKFRVLN